MEPTRLNISSAAALCRISVSTLNYYALKGVCRPVTDPNLGYRLFSAEDIDAVKRYREQHGREPASKQRRKASK